MGEVPHPPEETMPDTLEADEVGEVPHPATLEETTAEKDARAYYDYWKMARTSPEVYAPRPPTDECTSNWQCDGVGTYCFVTPGSGYTQCKWHSTGIGSICQTD